MKKVNNKETIKNAFFIAKEKMHHYALRRLAEFGEELLADARDRKAGWQSFTGNTITSLAFGLYENNRLTDVIFVSGVRPPVHRKIEEGDNLYLEEPYEGEDRAVKGEVLIYDDWGDETSIRTLEMVRPKGGNGIVITTGTEYSTFLEKRKDANVLSNTEMYARMWGLSWMKSGLDKNTPIDKL